MNKEARNQHENIANSTLEICRKMRVDSAEVASIVQKKLAELTSSLGYDLKQLWWGVQSLAEKIVLASEEVSSSEEGGGDGVLIILIGGLGVTFLCLMVLGTANFAESRNALGDMGVDMDWERVDAPADSFKRWVDENYQLKKMWEEANQGESLHDLFVRLHPVQEVKYNVRKWNQVDARHFFEYVQSNPAAAKRYLADPLVGDRDDGGLIIDLQDYLEASLKAYSKEIFGDEDFFGVGDQSFNIDQMIREAESSSELRQVFDRIVSDFYS